MKHIKNPLITGTLILTSAGFLSRIIGFFYRIFISHTYGEEGMGIFQLITPVMALSFSLCCAGIQTSVSKYIAAQTASKNKQSTTAILLSSLALTLTLSTFTSIIVYINSSFLAKEILLEERTAPLLRILAFSFPLSSIHCCINGYFYGIKNAKIPAFLQLSEQIFRVFSVYLITSIVILNNQIPELAIAVVGLVIGECSSALLSFIFLFSSYYKKEPLHDTKKQVHHLLPLVRYWSKKLIFMAAPLSGSRIIVNLLQSVESIYIPNKLQAYGLLKADALSVYGVLTGMALSLILFPSAITNSISVLLLPIVSAAEENKQNHTISKAINKSITYCALLGGICTLFFFLFGRMIGNILFHSSLCGEYITTLSFICPFLYITTTLNSILHGLGKTITTFFINVTALSIRILFVFFLIPKIGIIGYLIGLLLSQFFSSVFCIICLRKYRVY